jgi:3-methylcrotonyl-CoA carboxylase alpha subunit
MRCAPPFCRWPPDGDANEPGVVGDLMRTLLVANRGEIAVRVLRAAKAIGLRTVAVYSDADAKSLHVAQADAAVAIGPAKAQESYLRADAILAAARQSDADAIHPGYGFLAENAAFARDVEAAGLGFVGPRPEQIAAMGDKERARHAAKAAGVPVLPASDRLEPGVDSDLVVAADTVGFPLLVKAAAGGGGIGMRLVEDPSTLAATVAATQAIAQRVFGDGAVYLEHYVRHARHVEVQVFGLGDGRAVHLFERECSIQRRFQKIIEESPSPGIDPATRASMCEAAVALARAVSYRSAGTMEFVVDADSGRFFFLEMNTRIQVEHPVTEMRTGIDLVGMQLRRAGGEDVWAALQDVRATGHAIECRLCAENPDRMFFPSPGLIASLALPSGEGVRVDTGVRAGDTVTTFYDSLLAKLIVHAASRDAAIARMQAALAETEIGGIASNVSFLRRVLAHEKFAAGQTLTSFIDTHRAALMAPAEGKSV